LGGPVVRANGGVEVEQDGVVFALDPSGATRADFAFVSHAHIDHMHAPGKGERVIASTATRELAKGRGYDLGPNVDLPEGVELLDSGHILGSKAIRIGDGVFYTGDASGRERGFLGKCQTKSAKVLVMETTYGSPEYVFPEVSAVVKDVNVLISDSFDKGRPVVLMGYPLGKAQLLSYFFGSWAPLFYQSKVALMNEVHVSHGVPLMAGTKVEFPDGLDSLPEGPWVMVSPMASPRSESMARLKKKHGAVLVAFSGWATKPGYRFSAGADVSFPLSDHCDYKELVRLAEDVSPETVYTVHGFAAEFAADLRRLGFDAKPLGVYQTTMAEYR
jgi:putative mRNA 3-end processing factor